MSEEQAKEEVKAEKQEEVKEEKAAKKTAPKEAAPAEASADAEETTTIKESHSRNTKVTKMTMEQVEKAMAETTKKMGGLHSRYGRSLLERRAMLKKMPSMARDKAA